MDGGDDFTVCRQLFQRVGQQFPLVNAKTKLDEEFRLAAIVRVRGVKQIIHDFLAADKGLVGIG